MDREGVIKQIRSCVNSSKEKLSLRQLNKDYRVLIGEWIPFEKLGFKSLEDLIKCSNDLSLHKIGSDMYVTARMSDKSAHITEMVARQKAAKRKPPPARFSRYIAAPPRLQQTSQWRPKSQPNRYQASSRPREMNHAQFVNRSPVHVPAPIVASKVVVPEHSTFNKQKAAPPTAPVQQDLEPNRRMNTQRLNLDIKALSSTHNGNELSLENNYSPVSNINLDSVLPVRRKVPEIDSTQNSSNPIAATMMRIKKSMSALSMERDSGNSSPTNDSAPLSPTKTPEFTRTQDPLADLKCFAQMHRLGEVVVNFTKFDKKRTYSCRIKIGDKLSYASYPNEFHNQLEAQNFCCEAALADLIPKHKRKSLMISSEQDILASNNLGNILPSRPKQHTYFETTPALIDPVLLAAKQRLNKKMSELCINKVETSERIPPMLEKHNNGLWAGQLQLDYADKYNESLSADWLKIIDASPCVRIERNAEDYILHHCNPGDKGQPMIPGGVGVPPILSVPVNTVQFGEDGKLLAVVSCVVSASEIWCHQIGTEESDSFSQMFDRLQIYYQEHERNLFTPLITPANYYIAKLSDNYFRVRALKVHDTEIECFFIDLGDEISVPKSDILALRREYASLQAQAFVCRLSGLEDLYEVSANSQCLFSLQDKQVQLELASDLPSSSNSNDILPVFMYDVETGSSINEELIPQLTMELATPYLQQEGITEVYVSNIEKNGDMYVIVKTKGYETFQKQRQEIEEQIIAKPPTDILYRLNKSNSREKLYFHKHAITGTWERVKLIDWAPEGKYAQIYFVDKGSNSVIIVENETLYPLEALNDIFNNYPYQAVRVRMALKSIPDNFTQLAQKHISEEEPVLLKQTGKSEDALPLVKMFKRNTDGLFCINESIDLDLELKSKEKTENMMTKFRLNKEAQVPSTGCLKCPPMLKAAVDTCIPMHVSVAVSPYNFFVQPHETQSDLQQLMSRLQERYKNIHYGNLTVEEILPGNIYASRFSDGAWYRTSVIKVINSGSSVSVFYCDFGYYQTLSVKHLIPLDEEFLELPYQAVKAKLEGIKPVQSKWTVTDCELFKRLIEKRLLCAYVVGTETDILYQSDLVFKLVLIDTSSQEDLFISEELIRHGMAVSDDTDNLPC